MKFLPVDIFPNFMVLTPSHCSINQIKIRINDDMYLFDDACLELYSLIGDILRKNETIGL